MTLRNRFTLVTLGIIVFLLVTPFLILYARGFKIDWENKRLVKTGALVVKSEPEDAEVFLNDQIQESTTPVNIRFLLPDDYTISVVKEGYQAWTKRLSVKSQLVTWANLNRDFITLFLAQPKLEQVINATQVVPQPNQKIAFEQQGKLQTIDVETAEIFDIETLVVEDPVTPEAIIALAKRNNITLPVFSRGQMIETSGQVYLILDDTLYSLNGELEKIYSPVKFASFQQGTNTLVFSNDNEIYLYYPNDKKIDLIVRTLTPLKNASINHETGYIFFQNEGKLKAIEWDGRDHRNIFTLIDAPDNFLVSTNGKKLFTYNSTEIKYYIIR